MEASRKEYYEKYARRNILRELPPEAPLLFHEKLRTCRLIRYLPKKSCRVLDCGCGDGNLSALSAELGKKVTALDLSLERLKKFKVEAAATGIQQLTGDSCVLPFHDDSFDAVLVSELLEHVPEDELMLREIRRVLKRGGVFILSVPYKEMVNTVICPNCHFEFYRHGHLRSYDKTSLKRQLAQAGFSRAALHLSNNLKTRFLRIRRFLPLSWVASIDAFFSILFPEQSRFLIAVSKK